MWIHTGYQTRKRLPIGIVKIDLQKFCHLHSSVRVGYIFNNYQKYLHLCGKTEKLKKAVLAFFKQESRYKKMTSVRKSYISKFVKN